MHSGDAWKKRGISRGEKGWTFSLLLFFSLLICLLAKKTMTVAETDDVKNSLGIFYHRYTDSCLFYKHPFGGMINKKNGYMRRYSTSSIISGYSSATTATTNNIRHRKARSLGSIPLELMPPPGQQHHSHKIENRPDIICEKKAAATNITGR